MKYLFRQAFGPFFVAALLLYEIVSLSNWWSGEFPDSRRFSGFIARTIAAMVSTTIFSGISLFTIWLTVEKLGEIGVYVSLVLDIVWMGSTLLYIEPFLLYPFLNRLVNGVIQSDIPSLVAAGSLILGDIASIIAIYEFAKKRQW